MSMNQNGQLILNTLEKLEDPATLSEIVSYIAHSAGVDPVDIQECVEITLAAGLVYGYVQCRHRKYFATAEELDSDESESDAESEPDREDEDTEKTEMDDRSRRRRRGGRGKGHRSRSPRQRSRR